MRANIVKNKVSSLHRYHAQSKDVSSVLRHKKGAEFLMYPAMTDIFPWWENRRN